MASNPRHRIIHLSLTGLFLFAGIVGFKVLSSMKRPVARNDSLDSRPLTQTSRINHTEDPVLVRTYAEARAVSRLVIRPELSGQIQFMHTSLRQGGKIQAGETIVQIDSTPWRIALDRAKAQLLKAEATLAQREAESLVLDETLLTEKKTLELLSAETGRYRQMMEQGTVARQEYEQKLNQLQRQEVVVQSTVSRHKVQPGLVQQAKADLMAAKAQMDQADYDLKRTTIIAPFSGIVSRESVEPDLFITAGSDLGELISLATMEFSVPVPSHELPFLSLEEERLPDTVIRVLTPPGNESFSARVLHLAPEISQKTRTRDFIIEMQQDTTPQILPGSYCEVILKGISIPDAYRLPRLSVRNGRLQTVQQGKILWLPVETLRDEGDFVLARLPVSGMIEVVNMANEAWVDGTEVRSVTAKNP